MFIPAESSISADYNIIFKLLRPSMTTTDADLTIGDFCICLDDPWSEMRSLVVMSINGDDISVRLADPLAQNSAIDTVKIDRVVYNPYRNFARRMHTGQQATSEQEKQLKQAELVRAVTAHLTAGRTAVEVTILEKKIAGFLPELTSDFINVCLRSMAASKSLRQKVAKSRKSKSAKIKLLASETLLRLEQSSAFAFSFADELLNQSRRFGRLVSHRGTAGGFREELLRSMFRRTLAERYHVATGFIDGCDLQLDIIIYDRIDYAPIFREGDLVVVPMDSVRAVIEVKTNLTTTALREALIHLNGLPMEIAAPIFKGIFSFETTIPDNKILEHVASFYESDEYLPGQPYDEVTAICVLERQLVLTGYLGTPLKPTLSLIRNLMRRNFQAAVFLDAMQEYLKTDAPRVLPEGLTWRSRGELGATARQYMLDHWEIRLELEQDLDMYNAGHSPALSRISRTQKWLATGGSW